MRFRWTAAAAVFCVLSSSSMLYGQLRAPAKKRTLAARRPAAAKATSQAGNFDIRTNGSNALASEVQAAAASLTQARSATQVDANTMLSARDQLAQAMPRLEAKYDGRIGALEVLRNPGGALSAPAAGNATQIALTFIRQNASLYGLGAADVDAIAVLGESLSPKNGLRMVRVEQRQNGVPVFQTESRILVDRDGRVVKTLGLLVPGLSGAPSLAGLRSAADTLQSALTSVGIAITPAAALVSNANANGTRLDVVVGGNVKGAVTSQLVYFPLAPHVLVPAWMQISFTKGPGDYTTVTDARTGALLFRKNIRASASTQEARFSVYVQADGKTPAESPAPGNPTAVTPGSGTQFPEIARTTVSMSVVQDATASPDGWIPDGGNTTTGNNVDCYLDTDADDAPDAGLLDANGRPVGNIDTFARPRDFLGTGYAYTPAPMGGNPDAGTAPTDTQFRRGAVTHLFYLANWYHDRLYSYGFDEGAGNFQTNNFGRGGTGGDPVLAEAQDGSGTDNANFSTPPDGTSGRMQMYIFDYPTPNRDGALDATVVLHEMTHGLSNRLIGDSNGLIWDEGGGMGEGWSDFYALSLLYGSNSFNPNLRYAAGAYATYQFVGLTDNYLYGIRRFPYSTDNTVNPLTWADVDNVTYNTAGGIPETPLPFFSGAGALEVHNVGEIWANSLWEVRSRVIADPAGANGDVPTGNDTMLQLTTDALKMTPINPSFEDARDALIDADCATNACKNEPFIWGGFADRGLGYKSNAPIGQSGIRTVGGFVGVGESFSVPYLDPAGFTVNDSLGNNNGAIDPGEPISLTVNLLNPWRKAAQGVASATATLTSSTPGVTIITGSSAWPAIAAQATVPSTTPFVFTVSPSVLCGSSITFTLTTVSSLGTNPVTFTIRVGTPGGPGAPVTYTKTIAGGLAIPDDDLRGVFDSMTITDDSEITDVNFRVDSLTHTFTGDLAIGLKAPSGYGTDLIYLRAFFTGDGDGDNFTNTLIDGSSVHDLNLSPSSGAPFTGDWLPAFNSPIWSLFGIPNLFPDPVDQLGRLNGTSTQGVWKVEMRDEAAIDTGKLNSWSLIVTPRSFSCAAVTVGPIVKGTKTASGTFAIGGTVTYTVVLTNSGGGVQPDNPGNEFSDVLPAGLTLVNATATSGTATATVATNTVTWNGAIPPLGGTVTITITATVKPSAGGTNVSNQGTIAYDADANGTNETTTQTDDPGVGGASDPTVFAVPSAALVAGTKTVAGAFTPGSPVTYTVVLSNTGTAAQGDNPGNEFTDVLPSNLILVNASATSGAAVATLGTNTVTWNGSIAAGGSVTITISATVKVSATAATIVTNQGSISWDSDNNGTNDAASLTDNPAVAGAADPTAFAVVSGQPIDIPAVSLWGLAALAALLGFAAYRSLRF